jgi:hypothetical protein
MALLGFGFWHLIREGFQLVNAFTFYFGAGTTFQGLRLYSVLQTSATALQGHWKLKARWHTRLYLTKTATEE